MAITGYRILRKIRRGGMSTVYLAIQKSVDREVALKVMSPSLARDPSFGSRFYREAKIVGQLSHPNIVSIHDVGSHKQYNYIAMDFLPGAPLQNRLKEGISPQQALKITTEIASALDYAHSRGYIHRDIKPDNILFRADGSAVLCDFGIAKSLKGNINMTNVGSVMGTPHYMSPEQAQGKHVDGRSDLYGLGAVLFEMLSGNVPYTGNDQISIAVKHVSAPIPKLPKELRKFQPIINRLLAKKPSARFQTGKELISEIEQLQAELNNKNISTYLTATDATAVHVFGLIRALSATLASTLRLSIRRFMLSKKAFAGNAMLLSQHQLEELDQFVMDGHDRPTAPSIEPPMLVKPYKPANVARSPVSSRWRYWSVGIAILFTGALMYFNMNAPQQLQKRQQATPTALYKNTKTMSRLSSTTTADIATAAGIAAVAKTIATTQLSASAQLSATSPADTGAAERTAVTASRHPLTIKPSPADARVRILNIKPVYRPAMKLTPGSYHIEVSANGFKPRRFWTNIVNQPVTHSITLNPLQAGSIVVDKFANGSDGLKMVVLPSTDTSTQTAKIAFSQFEITYEQYDQFAEKTQRRLPEDYHWGRDQRPVVGITYQDAKAYAAWVSKQTGRRYRLPTQQEWALATRSDATPGTGPKYWWGNQSLKNQANCRRGCNSRWSRLFSSSTAPVGSYPANKHNLHDIVGNAAEWLSDCIDWKDEDKTMCAKALIAGGSHQDSAGKIKKERVTAASTDKSSKAIGLRLVLEL